MLSTLHHSVHVADHRHAAAAGGLVVLNWLIATTSAAYFTNWMIISLVNFRFHAALKAQNSTLFQDTYAWKSTAWPLAPGSLGLISTFLLVCCFYSGCVAIVCRIPPLFRSPDFPSSPNGLMLTKLLRVLVPSQPRTSFSS